MSRLQVMLCFVISCLLLTSNGLGKPVPLGRGESVEFIASNERETLRYSIIFTSSDGAQKVIWDTPQKPEGSPNRPQQAPYSFSGIAAAATSKNTVAVLLIDAVGEGLLVRADLNNRVDGVVPELINLPMLANGQDGTLVFSMSDPYTITTRKDGTTHTITCDAAGVCLFDGKPYMDAVGVMTMSPLPNGKYKMHDPGGRFGPPGDSIVDPSKGRPWAERKIQRKTTMPPTNPTSVSPKKTVPIDVRKTPPSKVESKGNMISMVRIPELRWVWFAFAGTIIAGAIALAILRRRRAARF